MSGDINNDWIADDSSSSDSSSEEEGLRFKFDKSSCESTRECIVSKQFIYSILTRVFDSSCIAFPVKTEIAKCFDLILTLGSPLSKIKDCLLVIGKFFV